MKQKKPVKAPKIKKAPTRSKKRENPKRPSAPQNRGMAHESASGEFFRTGVGSLVDAWTVAADSSKYMAGVQLPTAGINIDRDVLMDWVVNLPTEVTCYGVGHWSGMDGVKGTKGKINRLTDILMYSCTALDRAEKRIKDLEKVVKILISKI